MAVSSRRVFWLASVWFFLSGATGLAYEVIWFRRLAHVWGSSSAAVATVVASFLAGLGIGAWWFGVRADYWRRPLKIYGRCELAIGGLALVLPWALSLVSLLWGWAVWFFPAWGPLEFVLRFVATLLVLLPPCVLMGGTLPLLVRQFTADEGSLADATGWWYAVNTLGAACGCYWVGFHLLPAWGLLWTNNAAAMVNLLIGGAALWVVRAYPEATARKVAQEAGPRSSRYKALATAEGSETVRSFRSPVYAAAGAAGAAALVLQVTWNRLMATTVGGSTYAFTATLFVVLVGIGGGSFLYHTVLWKWGTRTYVAAVVIVITMLGVVVGEALVPWLCELTGQARERRASAWYNALWCVFTAGAMAGVPSLGAGVLFPLLVQATREGGVSAGRVVGSVYAWNTAGALLGAVLTAPVLFVWLGTSGALAVAMGLYTGALLALVPWETRRARTAAGTYAVLGGMLAFFVSRPEDPRDTQMGQYLHGYLPREARMSLETAYFAEGATSSVLVTKTRQGRSLRVNGKSDASTGLDMATQLGLAYFPRVFKPDARRVVVIGFGSGATAGASLLFPGTRVTCCEIEPAVYGAADEFVEVNHAPHKAQNFEIVFADGRGYLQGTDEGFDLVISEPSNPWLAGVSNLYTRQFFRVARGRLKEDGVLAQWVQTYAFSLEDFLLVVRTLKSEFPHVALVSLGEGADTILLASARPLALTADKVRYFQSLVDGSPAITADLERYFGGSDVARWLLKYYALDEQALTALVGREAKGGLHTDYNLRLEFEAPRSLFREASETKNEVAAKIAEATTANWLRRLAAEMGLPLDSPSFQFAQGLLDRRQGRLNQAVESLVQVTLLEPRMSEGYLQLAQAQEGLHQTRDAIDAYEQFLRLKPEDAGVHGQVGTLLAGEGRLAEATVHFREALRLNPDLISIKNNLAWLLATAPDAVLRNGPEAVKLADEACRATGYQQMDLLDTLAAAYAEVGNFEGAIRVVKLMLSRLSREAAERGALEERLALYEGKRPFREVPRRKEAGR